MKTTSELIAVVTVAGMGLAGAADKEGENAKGKPVRKAKGEGLKLADKSKDGKITPDKLQGWGAAETEPGARCFGSVNWIKVANGRGLFAVGGLSPRAGR